VRGGPHASAVPWRRLLHPRAVEPPPKGAGAYLAAALIGDWFAINRVAGQELTAELLTARPPAVGQPASARLGELAADVSDPRGQVIALAVVLGGIEARTGVHSWRTVDRATARYLRFLADTGYDLAPIERVAAGETVDPDGITDPIPTTAGHTDTTAADTDTTAADTDTADTAAATDVADAADTATGPPEGPDHDDDPGRISVAPVMTARPTARGSRSASGARAAGRRWP